MAGALLAELNRGRAADTRITDKQLAEQNAVWSAPLQVDYRGHRVAALPDAVATLETLLMLRDYDAEALGQGSADSLHLLVEAFKLATANPAETAVRLDGAAASLRRRQINPNEAREVAAAPPTAASTGVVAVDADGNQCVLAHTLGQPFGSGRGPASTGILLKSSTVGRMPLALMRLDDDLPTLAMASCGPGADVVAAQMLTALVDFDLPVQAAIDAPRVRIGRGTDLYVEPGLPSRTLQSLQARGHTLVRAAPTAVGNVQAIARRPIRKTLRGGSDGRADGAAVGY